MILSRLLILYLIASVPISFIVVSFIYDYFTWIEPLNNITSNDILFLDKGIHQGSYTQNHSPSMKKILYVENEGGEDYAMVELQSHEHSHMIPVNADYSTTIRHGDMLIVDCENDPKYDTTNVEAFYVSSMNSTYIEFHHYLLLMPVTFQCKFPEIIDHGLNMTWPEFAIFP